MKPIQALFDIFSKPLWSTLFLIVVFSSSACSGVMEFSSKACSGDLQLLAKQPKRRGCMTFSHHPKKLLAVQFKNAQFYFCNKDSLDQCEITTAPIDPAENIAVEEAVLVFPPTTMLKDNKPSTLYALCNTHMASGTMPQCPENAHTSGNPEDCWVLLEMKYKRQDSATCSRFKK